MYKYSDILVEEALSTINMKMFLPSQCHCIAFFGATGTGKTSALIDLYKKFLSKIFNDVYVFAKHEKTIETYKKMEPLIISYTFDRDIKKTREVFTLLYDQLKEDKENYHRKKLIIIDDYYDSDIEKNSGLIDFFISGRHMGCTTIFLCQYSKVMINPIIKNNCDMFFIFKCGMDDKKNMGKIVANSFSLQYPELSETMIVKVSGKILLDNVMATNLHYHGLICCSNGNIYPYIPKKKNRYLHQF